MRILEKEFPINLEEKWDNNGLIIGDKNTEITKVQISLDLTESVINNAIEKKCELIITHHPPIFEAIKKINNDSVLGKKILKLIKNGINVYTLHTNLDSAKEGLNQYIAEKLSGKNIKVLNEKKYELYKMNVFLPKAYEDELIKIINDSKESKLLGCQNESYIIESVENTLVDDELEKRETIKIGIIDEKQKLYAILNKIKEKDTFKELVYEIIALENKCGTGAGLGRIYEAEEPNNLEEYVKVIKEKLKLNFIKVVKSNDKKIKKVAIVNGSGAEFWKKAYDAGADLFITGDIKYHDALDAYEKGLNLVDIGHYEGEYFFNEIIIKKLDDNLAVEVYNEKRILEII